MIKTCVEPFSVTPEAGCEPVLHTCHVYVMSEPTGTGPVGAVSVSFSIASSIIEAEMSPRASRCPFTDEVETVRTSFVLGAATGWLSKGELPPASPSNT